MTNRKPWRGWAADRKPEKIKYGAPDGRRERYAELERQTEGYICGVCTSEIRIVWMKDQSDYGLRCNCHPHRPRPVRDSQSRYIEQKRGKMVRSQITGSVSVFADDEVSEPDRVVADAADLFPMEGE